MRMVCMVPTLAFVLAVCAGNGFGQIPSGGPIRLTMPTRMVKDKTLTLKTEIMDQYGCHARIDWRKWNLLGTVSARRVSDKSEVPTSITVFETYYLGAGGGTPPDDSIRFYNGVGSVSIIIDDPGSLANGEQIEVIVTADGKTASKVVTVFDNAPATFKELSGALSGANLTWGPADGVIHLTADVTVPSGSTLTINPGTLVMADKGSPQAGVTINVNGNVNAQGTEDDPIYFFATEGPSAMVMQPGNANAWGGIYHNAENTSTYSYTFITGGGNGSVGEWHKYPPMLRFFNSHSLEMSDCVLADSSAKLIHADYGGGSIRLSRSLLTRSGFGATFGKFDDPRAHMSALFEDTWFTRIGRGPEHDPSDHDGDACHWDSDNTTNGLRFHRCVVTDIGDDCVDGSDTFYMKVYFDDCIIYDLDDKLTTYWPGDAYANNLLLFACNKGFESVNGYPTRSTMADQRPFPWQYGGDWWVNQCIAAPGGTDEDGSPNYDCARFHADYTLLANSMHASCGTGIIVGDPLYVDPMTGGFPPAPEDYKSSYNYNLKPGSPALTAGPGGERIGWLGFPTAEPCSTDADCQLGGTYDDNNPCTVDACEVGICEHALIDQCIACCDDGDCDYGNPCVAGTCQADNTCSFAPVSDGTACDDGLFCTGADTCQDGICVSSGDPCAPLGCDEVEDECEDCATNGDCDDGLFCNGAETCVSNVCVGGIAPCDDPCEQCDESTDTCDWCIFDLDEDGFIGPGDFSFFAGCYGGNYGCDPPDYRSGVEPCCIANFDESDDSFVGPGDFSGFAGCFGLNCNECATCWGSRSSKSSGGN